MAGALFSRIHFTSQRRACAEVTDPATIQLTLGTVMKQKMQLTHLSFCTEYKWLCEFLLSASSSSGSSQFRTFNPLTHCSASPESFRPKERTSPELYMLFQQLISVASFLSQELHYYSVTQLRVHPLHSQDESHEHTCVILISDTRQGTPTCWLSDSYMIYWSLYMCIQ